MNRDLIQLLKERAKSPPRPPIPARLGGGVRTDPLDPDDPFTRQPAEVQSLVREVASGRPEALTAEVTTEGLVLHLWENAGEGLFTHRSLRVNATPPVPPPARSSVLGFMVAGIGFLFGGAGLLAAGWFGHECLRPQSLPPVTHDCRAEIDALTAAIRNRRDTPAAPVALPAPPPAVPVRYTLTLTVTPVLQPERGDQ